MILQMCHTYHLIDHYLCIFLKIIKYCQKPTDQISLYSQATEGGFGDFTSSITYLPPHSSLLMYETDYPSSMGESQQGSGIHKCHLGMRVQVHSAVRVRVKICFQELDHHGSKRITNGKCVNHDNQHLSTAHCGQAVSAKEAQLII